MEKFQPKVFVVEEDLLRRVVITGIGAVSPNGIGRENFWAATRRGTSGIRRIESFDPSALPVQIAGEIPDFDPLTYISEKDASNVSRVVPLAIAAAREAVADAGLDPAPMSIEERRRVAVLLGSGGGGQEFVERQYSLYYSGHVRQCSVYTIPSATIGTLASELSMHFGFRGFSHLISTGCTSSTDAIGYAAQNIRCGMAETGLCGGADAPIALPYLFIRAADPFARSRITRHDGPASVRQAYTREELQLLAMQAGFHDFVVERLVPFRIGLTIWATGENQ